MTTEALTHFIIDYIASRKQPKLDALKKRRRNGWLKARMPALSRRSVRSLK